MKMHQVQNSNTSPKNQPPRHINLQTNINKSLHDDGACVVIMQRSSNRERKKSAKAVAADELVEKRKIAAAAKKAKKKKKEEGGEVRKEVAKAGAEATSNPKSSKRKPRSQPGGKTKRVGSAIEAHGTTKEGDADDEYLPTTETIATARAKRQSKNNIQRLSTTAAKKNLSTGGVCPSAVLKNEGCPDDVKVVPVKSSSTIHYVGDKRSKFDMMYNVQVAESRIPLSIFSPSAQDDINWEEPINERMPSLGFTVPDRYEGYPFSHQTQRHVPVGE